ncbi:hypothetical protein DFH06DRAFT_1352017 [Mycena polygramma]|nr:hypothetical protein DFH06DRAFT_1352017 [Mycena polygramma]
MHDWEWATKPDLDHTTAPHRAYIPRANQRFFNKDHRDWVFAWNVAMDTSDVAPYRCLGPESTCVRMASDEAWAWASHICSRCPGLASGCPPRPELKALTALYTERSEFNAAIWEVRRGVLELYGFIAGALLNMKDWRKSSWADSLVDKIDHFRILVGPKRGVFLDVTELNEEVARRYVAHGVPIHYRWRFRPSPTGSLAAFAPLAIGAFDFDERRRRAQAEFERECNAKRAAGRKKAFSAAGTSTDAGKKNKKKWFKLVDDEGEPVPISAAEGRRLANEFKVDMSKSTDTGEIAIVHEGVFDDDGEDDEDNVSMYLAPAPPLPEPRAAVTQTEPRSLEEAPEEWPALPSQAVQSPADVMEVDEEVAVFLGDEDEDLLARNESVADAGGQEASVSRMEVDEIRVDAPSSTSARQAYEDEEPSQDMAVSSTRRMPAASERYGSDVHPSPKGRRERREHRGRHSRSHSISGDARRDGGRERFQPYSPSRHWRARTRSRSRTRKDSWHSDERSGSWPSRPRTPSPLPTEPALAASIPRDASVTEELLPPASPAPSQNAATLDMASLNAEDARRVLVNNLSAASAQQLLEVLLRQSEGGAQALLAVLSSPEGSDPAVGIAPKGSFGGRIREATGAYVASADDGQEVARTLSDRMAAPTPVAAPDTDPLISRLGLPLEMRLASGAAESLLQARLGEGNAPTLAMVSGTKAACSAWIQQTMLRNGNTVTDTSPFSGNPAVIQRPAGQPAANLRIAWEPHTELHIRRWFMSGAARTVREAVGLAFELGCAVQVWTPAPPGWHPSAWQRPAFPPLPYLPHMGGDTFFSGPALLQYKANIAAVLSRPHARGALVAGGFLWRIALEWGPRWLIDDLWRATDPRREWVEYDASTHRVAPALSHEEVDALLGVAVAPCSSFRRWTRKLSVAVPLPISLLSAPGAELDRIDLWNPTSNISGTVTPDPPGCVDRDELYTFYKK